MYNQENGVNEFAAICNVTFKGMEMAGSFTKETAKAFLKLAKFLMTAKTWAKNKVKDHEYQRAGKKKQKVMKDKFQGEVLYGKIESVKSIAEKQSSSIRVLSEDQRERLPDKKWVISNLKKLAKAHGLEYCVLPNKKSNDSFIQYPKQQEAVYQEIVAELQEQMKKECEKLFIVFDKENEQKCEQAVIACKEAIAAKKEEIKRTKEDLQSYRKVNDKVGEEKYGEKLIILKAELEDLKEKKIELTEKWNEARKQNGKDLIEQLPEETKEAVQGQVIQQVTGAQYLEQSGLLGTSDEEFDAIMKDTFPLEYAEIEKSIQQKAEEIKEGQRTDPAKQEQKKEFVRQVNQETRKEEKKKGTIVDIEIPAAAYVKTGENEISFPHPDYPEFMITVPANGICGTVDSSNVKRENGKLEGYLTCSVYKDAEISIRVPVLNAISGKPQMDSEGAMQFVTNRMTYEEFNKHVKDVGATAAAAMWKKQRELQKAARKEQRQTTITEQAENVVNEPEKTERLGKAENGQHKVVADQIRSGRSYDESAQRMQYIPKAKEKNIEDITITKLLIAEESDHAIKTRVPGMYGENEGYIWLDKENITDIHEGKTMLSFLDRNKEYKIYSEDNDVIKVMKGSELYDFHYDEVNKRQKEAELKKLSAQVTQKAPGLKGGKKVSVKK